MTDRSAKLKERNEWKAKERDGWKAKQRDKWKAEKKIKLKELDLREKELEKEKKLVNSSTDAYCKVTKI